MMEDISYNFLWELLQKERSTNTLQLIPKNFYDDVYNFIKENKAAQKQETQIATAENMVRIADEIFEKRKQKIILYVAYKKQLPSPTVDIEVDFYNKLKELYTNTKPINQPSQKPQEKLTVIIEKLPEVFLPSGIKIGPLQKGQAIEVKDKTDREFLIDNSLCVYEKL